MSEEPEDPPKRRRRWKRWFLGFIILLVGILIWANGPGARWGVKSVILQQLEAQKLSGDYEVEGSLASGLSIHNLNLTGESKIQKVESDLLKLDWTVSSLLKKQITGITLNRLHLVIDPKAPALPAKPGEDEQADEDPDPAALEKTLNLVRNLLDPATIKITDVSVEVREITSVTLAALTHEPGSEDYIFKDFNGQDHLNRPVSNPRSTLTWTEKGFALDQLTVLPTLSIRDLTFAPGGKLATDLALNDTRLGLVSNLSTDHAIELKSPALDLKEAAWVYEPELPASGKITALKIDTSKGFVNLQGSDLQWKDQKLASASIEARAKSIVEPFAQPIEIKIALADQLDVDGTVTLQKEILDSEAAISFTLRDERIPTVTGKINYDSREARLLASALDGVRVNGSYYVDSSTYQAQAVADLQNASELDPHLTGPLKFTLSGKGSIPDNTHEGTLNLASLALNQPNLPSATSQGEIKWNWPESVTVERLQMDSPEGQLNAKLAWSNDTLTIDSISLVENNAPILSASGTLPAPLKMPPLNEFLDSDAPLTLTVKSQPLTFKKLANFAPIPETLSGVIQADLELTGSLAKPQLNGFTSLDDFRLSTQPTLPPASVRLNFKTENQKLLLTANAREPGGPLIDVDGELPFLPRAWIDRKKSPAESPIKLTANSPELDLKRIQPFVSAIKSVDGSLKLDFQASGTLADPVYSGTAKAKIQQMRIADSPISDFRNADLNIAFAGKTVTIQPSSISASGGDLKLRGKVELGGEEPVFDIAAKGEYILLSRTKDYTFRGNPDLTIRGPFSAATIAGKVEIVESLFYKDVEILPFGVPRTTEIPRPNLPTFTQKPTPSTGSKKPGGFNDWKLDLNVITKDPILVRGNLAQGEIAGMVRVFGTIGSPKTSGALSSKDLVADLPFSDLKVLSGVVTLRPESLTNPIINLRGTSSVGQYTVEVYLTGPVQNPTLLLTSNPPLPESEIMLLLATGSASAQLEDRQVASQKALQYLLEGIRRRNGEKDKTVLQRLIKNSDQIELSLGDANQYSGRKFSSATLEISDRFDFTTQIDDLGQTRALVVFSIRFR